MDVFDYAIAKKMFGGSGSSEVSGTIDINENGTYNVAKYAHANVNVASSGGGESGVPIEVAELPTPTADDVGKVYLNTTDGNYYVGEQNTDFLVGEPLGDKIYFDTSKDIPYTEDSVEVAGILAYDIRTDSQVRLDIMSMYEASIGHICMVGFSAMGVDEDKIYPMPIYINSDGLTAEQLGQMLGGLPISRLGWQIDSNPIDMSAFAHYIVDENNLSAFGNFAYKEKTYNFNNVATGTLNALLDKSITEIDSDVTEIGHYTCYSCQNLTSVNLPRALVVYSNAFQYCGALTNVSLPVAHSVSAYVFSGCSKLKNIDLPNSMSISTRLFEKCTSLTTVNAPLVGTINQYGFIECTALTNIDLPSVMNLQGYAFQKCYRLKTANLPKAVQVDTCAFESCFSLTKLIIGTDQTTVATLGNTNVFNSCYHILGTVNSSYNPNGLKDGYIYVPLSLVADYRSATNWATYATQIMPYVTTVAELANIDGTTYDKACVGDDYVEYTYNGTSWEVYR